MFDTSDSIEDRFLLCKEAQQAQYYILDKFSKGICKSQAVTKIDYATSHNEMILRIDLDLAEISSSRRLVLQLLEPIV